MMVFVIIKNASFTDDDHHHDCIGHGLWWLSWWMRWTRTMMIVVTIKNALYTDDDDRCHHHECVVHGWWWSLSSSFRMMMIIILTTASYTDDDDYHNECVVHGWWWSSSSSRLHHSRMMIIIILTTASYTDGVPFFYGCMDGRTHARADSRNWISYGTPNTILPFFWLNIQRAIFSAWYIYWPIEQYQTQIQFLVAIISHMYLIIARAKLALLDGAIFPYRVI